LFYLIDLIEKLASARSQPIDKGKDESIYSSCVNHHTIPKISI